MEKKLIVLLFVCLHNSANLYAQWTKEDSVWLNKVLSGKEELRLNPETLKAIQEGSLINTDISSPDKQMKSSPMKLPLAKDFSEYVRPERLEKAIDPLTVSPSVYMRYTLDQPLQKETYNKAAFGVPQNVKDNAKRPTGISFDDVLRGIFQPSFRNKTRNRKNAAVWRDR